MCLKKILIALLKELANRFDIAKERHIVLIVIDGLRHDKLQYYLNNNASNKIESGLKEIMQTGNKIQVDNASTVFPSITLAANASIFTGKYPRNHGIAANIFYKVDKQKYMDYETKELAPTLFGFWDQFGQDHWAALLGGMQNEWAGEGGLDKDLQEYGVYTIYEALRDWGFDSHVIFNFYSKGAKTTKHLPKGLEYLGDGWDPARKDDLLFGKTLGGNDPETFFNYFDKRAAESAVKFIDDLDNNNLDFPKLFTLYFASVDHASHLYGLQDPNRGDIQLKFLSLIDDELFKVITEYKTKFPVEFDNTIFIITSDHGHEKVDPEKVIVPEDIDIALRKGPWNTTEEVFPMYYAALGGPCVQLYFKPKLSEEYFRKLVGNLCYNFQLKNNKVTVIARAWFDKDQYWIWKLMSMPHGLQMVYDPLPSGNWPDINKMLNNKDRSGSIILHANTADGWQFADSKTQAEEFHIKIKVIKTWVDERIRIPLSEYFVSKSTHGGVPTMRMPLMFFGKSIPKNQVIEKANVVDIFPTILSILGLFSFIYFVDGKELIDVNLIKKVP